MKRLGPLARSKLVARARADVASKREKAKKRCELEGMIRRIVREELAKEKP